MNRLLSILRGGGGGTAGGCVAFNATITGLHACAENSNNTASGEASHAEGDTTIAAGNYSHAQNWNTQAAGVASSAHGFDCWAPADLSMAIGNQSATLEQSDFAHSSGQFAERGDNQYRFHELRGETPGVVPGESVKLRIGNTENDVRPGRVYAVTCTVLAVRMGEGPGPRDYAQFVRRFVLTGVRNSGFNETISAVQAETDIISGPTFAGASLLPEVTQFNNEWTLTLALGEFVTANIRAVAHAEFVELLASPTY